MRKLLGVAAAAALALMAHVAAADQVKGKISKINLTDNTFEVGGQPFAASPTNTVGAKLSELKNGDTVQVSYAHTNLTGNQSINAMSLTKLASAEVLAGLITKTEANPFFVKMREGAAGEGQGTRPRRCRPTPASTTATMTARSRRSRA